MLPWVRSCFSDRHHSEPRFRTSPSVLCSTASIRTRLCCACRARCAQFIMALLPSIMPCAHGLRSAHTVPHTTSHQPVRIIAIDTRGPFAPIQPSFAVHSAPVPLATSATLEAEPKMTSKATQWCAERVARALALLRATKDTLRTACSTQ